MRAWIIPALAMAAAQQPSPEPTFRAGTELIQVDVVAQDKDGKPVTDLRREDFQIFDNGAPQEIRLFLADRPAPASGAAMPPGEFTNRIVTDVHGGYAVLLFDNLNVDPGKASFGHTARARQKALQALATIPPGDRIAIYALGCRFQVVREFTSDRDLLMQKLEAFAPAPAGCLDPGEGPEHSRLGNGRGRGGRGTGSDGAPDFIPHGDDDFARVASAAAAEIGDSEFSQLADHLAGIPGRKNLLWLTSTFRLAPVNMQKLINAAAAIYPVDTLGSMIAMASAKKARAAMLNAIAAPSGGIFYFDRDDLDVAIRGALNDGLISYTLGFYQTDDDKRTPVHQIGVRVSRPGVILRYRTSYTIQPPQPASTNPVHDLIQAMNRPVDATAIGITASAARIADRLDLSVNFEIAALDLKLTDGLWKGQTELLARFATADGVQAGDTLAETVTFNLRPATYASMLEKGAHYHKEIPVPANAVELKLLVGSLASGKIGTLTIPLAEVK